MSDYGMRLHANHAAMLEASGITPDHARIRGYVSVDTRKRLEDIGVTRSGRRAPGLLVPQLRRDGSVWGYQYRPDDPRVRDGKLVKYETPTGQRNGIDVPPGVGLLLDDIAVPLWVTEGVKKADAAALAGLCCVALPGVWSWRGRTRSGGKVAVSDWHDIALNGRRVILAFDSDVVRKRAVRRALDELAGYLASKGGRVEYLHLPDDDAGKCGLDDYLADGHSAPDILGLVRPDPPAVVEEAPRASQTETGHSMPVVVAESADPVPLGEAQAAFRRWLHIDDMAPVLAVAGAVVANLAPGDPVWLLIVGPPSGGKTEVLSSCAGLPYVTAAATISEAALLSGTSNRERAKDATGGLLRQIGGFGILLAKDFTSVLSQNRDTAKAAMAALREVYDGSWDRPVGSDGGRVLRWLGKCGFIGGVTPTFDRYGTVVSALGDRFVLLRLPDVDANAQALSALDNGDHEKEMRADLARVMQGLIAGADLDRVHRGLTDDDRARFVRLASFAARARTAVERDGYSGELLVIPQPEGPARLVKAMRRLHGGLSAIGADEHTCWSVLSRVALDCAPAIRIPLLRALLAADNPMRTSDVAEHAGMVTKTAHRQLDDIALLGLADRTKTSEASNAPDLWSASPWLRDHWPEEVGQRSTTRREGEVKEAVATTVETPAAHNGSSAPRTSLSHLGLGRLPGRCQACGFHIEEQGHRAGCLEVMTP
jgi:hypothetical protein